MIFFLQIIDLHIRPGHDIVNCQMLQLRNVGNFASLVMSREEYTDYALQRANYYN